MGQFFYEYIRPLIFLIIVRPLVFLLMGIRARGKEHLPRTGPAIVVANHNSHLDTVVLLSLFPVSLLRKIRPAAAADYFMKGPLSSWFSKNVIGVIPVVRGKGSTDPLKGIRDSLTRGEIVVFFPEGTRGEPEKMSDFKMGIALLAEQFPKIPVIPVYLHGLGKSLPRGDPILIPFCADVLVGEPVFWNGDRVLYLENLRLRILDLSAGAPHQPWQ